MSRKHFATAPIVQILAFVLMGICSAQTVKVVDKPGDGQWTISFSRKNGPDVFELDTFRKTKAEALQEAEHLKAWSNSMDANSSWRLAVILIEGEDARPAKPKTGEDGGEAPKVRDPVQMLQEANKRLMDDLSKTFRDINKEDVKNALEKKNRELQDDIKRVTKAKEYLVKNVDKLTDDDFKQINGLISSYNTKLENSRREPNGAAFSNYPRMNPVTPSSLDKVRRWKQAKANQAQLADDKQRLDGERSRIDQERAALAQEGRSIQAEEAELQKLRQQSSGGGVNAGPPYEVWTWTTDTVDTGQRYPIGGREKPVKYQTLHDAQKEARQQDDAGRPLGLQRWMPSIIVDRSGNDVTNAAEVSTTKVDKEDLAKREEELRQRREEYNRRLQKYRSELLAGYNQRLNSHQNGVRSHGADVQSLSGGGSAGSNWLNPDGSIRWPSNNGFSNVPERVTLQPGALLDRYGYEDGTFVSPRGVPYAQRSLPPRD